MQNDDFVCCFSWILLFLLIHGIYLGKFLFFLVDYQCNERMGSIFLILLFQFFILSTYNSISNSTIPQIPHIFSIPKFVSRVCINHAARIKTVINTILTNHRTNDYGMTQKSSNPSLCRIPRISPASFPGRWPAIPCISPVCGNASKWTMTAPATTTTNQSTILHSVLSKFPFSTLTNHTTHAAVVVISSNVERLNNNQKKNDTKPFHIGNRRSAASQRFMLRSCTGMGDNIPPLPPTIAFDPSVLLDHHHHLLDSSDR